MIEIDPLGELDANSANVGDTTLRSEPSLGTFLWQDPARSCQ
jgi:hypothetical protein